MASNDDLIIKLRAETAQLRKDLNKAKAQMGTFGKNVNKIGASIRNSMLTAFGGLAVLQGIRSAIGSLVEFEFAMDKVAAISGAVGKDLGNLQENALELGRTTKFTASEIAGLQLELSKLGFSSDKIVQSTDAIRKLATVADEDLAESAKTLAGTLNSFNLKASESERVANTMAESFSKSALTLEKFTVGTANSGAIANALGITLEQNTARLGALVDANIDASKAGTDLRKIYIELNKAGIDYESALDMVSKSSDKVATATELVGIRAAGALVILSNQRKKVDELNKSLSDNNKELDGMVDIMEDNLLTDWKKFTSALDGAIQKAQEGLPVMRRLTQIMTDVTNAASDTFDTVQQGADKAVSNMANKVSDLKKRVTLLNETYTKQTEKLRSIAKQKAAIASAYGKENELALVNDKQYQRLTANYTTNLAIIKALRAERSKAIAAIDSESSSTRGLIDDTEELLVAQKKALASLKTIAEERLKALDQVGRHKGALYMREDQGARLGINSEDVDKSIKKFSASIKNSKEELQAEYSDVEDSTEAFASKMNSITEGVIESMIFNISKAIGEGANIKDIFGIIMGIIGQGLQQIGSALIAYGVAMESFKKAFKNPYAAIAAGAVLVAAGSALSASVSSMNNKMSGGGGGGGGSRGGGRGNFSAERTEKTIKIEGLVSGRNLALVLANENQNKSRNGG